MKLAVIGGGIGGLDRGARARRRGSRRARARGGRRARAASSARRSVDGFAARARGELVPRRAAARRARAVQGARRRGRQGRAARRRSAGSTSTASCARCPAIRSTFVRSDLLTWRGKLDLLREPFVATPRAGGEDESMYAFAARRLGAAGRARDRRAVRDRRVRRRRARRLARGRLPAARRARGRRRPGARHGQADDPRAARAGGPARRRTQRGLYAPVGGLGALIDGARAPARRSRRGRGSGARDRADAATACVVDGERFDGCVLAIPAQDAAPAWSARARARAIGSRAFTRVAGRARLPRRARGDGAARGRRLRLPRRAGRGAARARRRVRVDGVAGSRARRAACCCAASSAAAAIRRRRRSTTRR